jgi:hypothetical protein
VTFKNGKNQFESIFFSPVIFDVRQRTALFTGTTQIQAPFLPDKNTSKMSMIVEHWWNDAEGGD